MIRAGIVGGTGYTGGELIRLLLHHPHIEIDFVYSHSRAGMRVDQVHLDLLGQTKLVLTDQVNPDVDVLFLCLGHGRSGEFLRSHPWPDATLFVDLSNEYRLRDARSEGEREFVYGLPELKESDIREARAIANPGCFATAIQLALLPLAANGLLDRQAVHINAVTGSTGAGAALSETGQFSWRTGNMSYYKPFVHQHLGEIHESLASAGALDPELYFLPLRGNFSRGIFATAYLRFTDNLETTVRLYRDYYEGAPYTQISEQPLDLKSVVNTNHCFIHLHRHADTLLITSVIDNLLKGASGQAVENANIALGLPRKAGLQLKNIAF